MGKACSRYTHLHALMQLTQLVRTSLAASTAAGAFVWRQTGLHALG